MFFYHHKTELFGGSFIYISRFFKAKGENWNIFLGLLDLNYFLGMPDIPDTFWVQSADAGSNLRIKNKIRVTPGSTTSCIHPGLDSRTWQKCSDCSDTEKSHLVARSIMYSDTADCDILFRKIDA